MKLKFLLLSMLCIGMIACSKDNQDNPSPADGNSKSIVMKISTPVTRANITPDNPYETTTHISVIDVYFTNSNSTIQQAFRLQNADLDYITSKGLRFVNLSNVTAVYVVANSTESLLNVGDRLDRDFITRLRNQSPLLDQGQMIFAGCDTNISPAELDSDQSIPNYSGNSEQPQYDIDHVYTASITIRPLISRIEWGKITLNSDGTKQIQDPDSQKWYLVEWKNWKPTLTGIFQSNVYVAEHIFAPVNNQMPATNLFATPTLAANAIIDGKWVKPNSPVVGDDVWAEINSAISYTGYEASTPGAMLDLDSYNQQTNVCVPFHFLVPFDPSINGELDENTQALATTPQWHFQLHYPDLTNGSANPDEQFTVKVYESNAAGDKGAEVDLNADDAALAIYGDFLFPTGTKDNMAYANVVELLDPDAGTSQNQSLIYLPGKIYTTDIELAPFNISASFHDPSQYNIIVKVTVSPFSQKAVKPSFDAQ